MSNQIEDPVELYLGENVVITDKISPDGGFDTTINAPRTKIIDHEDYTDILVVKTSADFCGIQLNNVGEGTKDTDAANVKQVISKIADETERAKLKEAEFDNLIKILNVSIERLFTTLDNEIKRASEAERILSTRIESLDKSINKINDYFFRGKK